MRKLLLKLLGIFIWIFSWKQEVFASLDDDNVFMGLVSPKIEEPKLTFLQKISEFFRMNVGFILFLSEVLFIVGMLGSMILYFFPLKKIPLKLRKFLVLFFGTIVILTLIEIVMIVILYFMNS